jgi:hypothetical protein
MLRNLVSLGGKQLPQGAVRLLVCGPRKRFAWRMSQTASFEDMTEQQMDLASLLLKLSASRRGQEMAIRLRQSLEITDSLWDLVPIVTAAGEKYEQRTPTEVADSSGAAELVSAERRQAVRQLGDQLLEVMNSSFEAQTFDESVLEGLSLADMQADLFGIVNQSMDTPAYVTHVLQALTPDLISRLSSLSADEGTYLAAYVHAVEPQPKTPALLRALFAAAVGAVEPLVTRMVLILLYEKSPEAYTSMADARLDKRARELAYGAPGKWREALVGRLGLSSLADAIDWDGLALLWEARNVVAHRGGIVDARYSQHSKEEIGSLVASEPEAVRSAIDQIGAIRFAIVAGTWDHLTQGMGSVIADSTGIPLRSSLRAGRWRQAVGLARAAEAFASDPEDTATAMVNGWLALEQGRGREAIAAAVEGWDVAALPPIYAVARHLLLRHDDEALALLACLVADGTIDTADLASWPLFDRVREEGLLSELMN